MSEETNEDGPDEELKYSGPHVSTERRLSLRMSDGLYRELTLRKLDEGRPLNSIITDAIRVYLKVR